MPACLDAASDFRAEIHADAETPCRAAASLEPLAASPPTCFVENDDTIEATRRVFGRIVARGNRRSRAADRLGHGLECDRSSRRSRLASAFLCLTASGRIAATESPATPCDVVPLPPARDRRAFPRHPTRCVALIHRLEGHLPPGPQLEWAFHGTRWTGDVLDISISGAALVVEAAPAVSDTLRLRFQNRLLGTTVDATVVVLRVEPAIDQRIKVMCEFTRHLPLDQVRSLGWEPFESSLI